MSDDLLAKFFEQYPLPEPTDEEREESRKGREIHAKLTHMKEENSIVRIWCDGRVKFNPGLAGWAALLDYNGTRKLVYGNSGEERLTNQVAQIEAAIFALEQLKRPCSVELMCDSQYVVNVANGLWTAKTNFNEWERLEYTIGDSIVKFKWVKGLTTPEQQIVRTKAESMIGAKVIS